MAKSIRISDQFYDVALHAGEAMGRSLAQQLEHWARMGAALDAAGITFEQTVRLLQGRADTQGKLLSVLNAAGDRGDGGAALAAQAAARRQQLESDVRSGKRSATSLFLFSPDVVERAKLRFVPEDSAAGADGW
jgi:ParD-like antitoxin of type II bacterial toxin-antitoxin system